MLIVLALPTICLACSTLFIVRTPRPARRVHRDTNSMEGKTKVRFSSVTLFRETHTR
jgi:hypothetical protein